MQIWVDADACPRPIKEILFRAAERCRMDLILVANQPLRVPPSPHIRTLQVAGGLDEADREIVRRMAAGDLVVTADVPLAAAVIDRGGLALDPRGELLTPENIRERLTVRNLLDEMRGSGFQGGGPPALGPKDRQAFANRLDTILARHRGG
jgi:uncharacterized protein